MLTRTQRKKFEDMFLVRIANKGTSLKRFNFDHFNFPGKFLLSYNTAMVYTGCYQCNPPEQLKQNTNKKTTPIQKKSFMAEFIPLKRFNFPGKFLLSYNTAMVYTGCYQCNPPEQLKQNTNGKLLRFKKKAFIAELIPVKRFNVAHFNFPGKFLLSYNTVLISTQVFFKEPSKWEKQEDSKKIGSTQNKSY